MKKEKVKEILNIIYEYFRVILSCIGVNGNEETVYIFTKDDKLRSFPFLSSRNYKKTRYTNPILFDRYEFNHMEPKNNNNMVILQNPLPNPYDKGYDKCEYIEVDNQFNMAKEKIAIIEELFKHSDFRKYLTLSLQNIIKESQEVSDVNIKFNSLTNIEIHFNKQSEEFPFSYISLKDILKYNIINSIEPVMQEVNQVFCNHSDLELVECVESYQNSRLRDLFQIKPQKVKNGTWYWGYDSNSKTKCLIIENNKLFESEQEKYCYNTEDRGYLFFEDNGELENMIKSTMSIDGYDFTITLFTLESIVIQKSNMNSVVPDIAFDYKTDSTDCDFYTYHLN